MDLEKVLLKIFEIFKSIIRKLRLNISALENENEEISAKLGEEKMKNYKQSKDISNLRKQLKRGTP